jgi:Cu+-exporting ATPase
MGTGTDVAIEQRSITLVKGDLRASPARGTLSRATMANIRSRTWSSPSSTTPLAMPDRRRRPLSALRITLSPIFAAAAMALSSVSVIGNALRLRRIEI